MGQPLRIVLAPSAYYPHVGGIEETARQLALEYQRRGHHASVLTNRWPEGVREREFLDGIHVTRLQFRLPAANARAVTRFLVSAPRGGRVFLRHLQREQADVVHVIGGGPPAVYVAVLRGRVRARVVFTAAGELTFDAQRVFESSAVLRAGLRLMLHRADAVTACSAYVLQGLESFAEFDAPAAVIPNGVDPREFNAAAGHTAPPGRYVLAVGRLVPQKGFDVLLDAFARSTLNGVRLVIAGDGIERSQLEARARELGVTERVSFLGVVNRARLAALLRGADLFAFPSRGEAFGIALLEAMAAGVPSVAAAAGGIPELARDGENAVLVPPDDVDALAQALARVATDPALRHRLVVEGRRTAAALAWDRIADRYLETYRQATPASE